MEKKHYIGQNLLLLMAKSGMTQSELGDLSHMSQATISRLISNQQTASESQIKHLAKALEVPEEYFTLKIAPSFSIDTQNGGYAGNYHFHYSTEAIVAAKDAHILHLEKENKRLADHVDRLEEQMAQLHQELVRLLRQK